jgi:hypothetical protein
VNGGQKPGFFQNTSPHLVETAKNPVSLLLAGPETGFFREFFATPRRSSQKPGFFKTQNELFSANLRQFELNRGDGARRFAGVDEVCR